MNRKYKEGDIITDSRMNIFIIHNISNRLYKLKNLSRKDNLIEFGYDLNENPTIHLTTDSEMLLYA